MKAALRLRSDFCQAHCLLCWLQMCGCCFKLNKHVGRRKAWRCSQCGAWLDRDANAARNITMLFLYDYFERMYLPRAGGGGPAGRGVEADAAGAAGGGVVNGGGGGQPAAGVGAEARAGGAAGEGEEVAGGGGGAGAAVEAAEGPALLEVDRETSASRPSGGNSRAAAESPTG